MYVRYGPLPAALLAAAVGLALGTASPAAAATTPTISAPAAGLGFGPISITGTATPGATVTLIEAAYIFRTDMNPATDFDTGGTVTATANSSGHYAITRVLDSGFVFAVEAEGLRSRTIPVGLRLSPELTVSTTGSTVTVGVAANLGQAGLPVHIQRASGSTWTTVDSGSTDANGDYSAAITGQTVGATERFRAYLEESVTSSTGYADPSNNLWSNWTDSVSLVVGSAGAQTRTAATGVPTPPDGVSVPTTPTTPTTPTKPTKPTKPAPRVPAVGAVQFSKIQFDSPGKDTGSTASLNAEYFRLTNKTKATIDLKGWTVRDAANHVYTFAGHKLGAGRTVYVHTGRGTNGRPDAAHRYWSRSGYIWNNGGDSAALRTGAGKTIDSCRYTRSSKGYTSC